MRGVTVWRSSIAFKRAKSWGWVRRGVGSVWWGLVKKGIRLGLGEMKGKETYGQQR